jgi:putative thioredoxin
VAIDVSDATFQAEVIDKSHTTAVVVDLWAPWCGPCRTIGPILEQLTDESNGQVILAKVNVDENPAVSQAFQVQSIPAVYAMKDGKVVDGFLGAQPEHMVREFVQRLMPEGIVTLEEPPVEVAEVPSAPPDDNFDDELATLLPLVKTDEDARGRYLEILELMGPDDARTAGHRRRLTAQLF